MANEIKNGFNSVYADGPTTAPMQPQKSEIRGLGATIQASVDALQAEVSTLEVSGDTITRKTWTQLADIAGTRLGQRGEAAADPGTHTDPVVGGTVPNQGIYGWSVSTPGWQWLRADDVATTNAEVVAARRTEPNLGARVDKAARIPVQAEALARVAGPRDAVFGYSDLHVLDRIGRVLFGVGLDGSTDIQSPAFIADDPRATGSSVVLPFLDAVGKLLAYFSADGSFTVSGFGVGTDDPRATGSSVVLEFVDDAGLSVFRFFSDGSFDGIPSSDFLDRISGGGSSDYATLFGLRKRPGGGFLGSVEEAGIAAIYDVISASSGPGYVVSSQYPLDVIPVYGESTAGSGGNTGVELAAELYPFAAMEAFPKSNARGDLGAVAAPDIVGMAAASDAAEGGQFPATLLQFAIEALRRRIDSSVPTTGTLGYTSWYGGQSLDKFLPGQVAYDNLITAMGRIKTVAPAYKRRLRCPAVIFSQGANRGSYNRATYLADASVMFDQLLPELQEALSVDEMPKAIITQANTWLDAGWTGIELAQGDIALARGDVVLAGPTYQAPVGDPFTTAGDIQIHPSALGVMMTAEVLALAWLAVVDTGDFSPLRPIGVARSGSTIDISFALPEGNALAFDTGFILAPTGATNPRGFTVLVSGSPVAISSVALLDADTVRITCASPPGPCTVRYAMTADSPEPGGWVNSRGQLYSPSSSPSPFAALGYAIPSIIRHYAVKFEMEA